MKYFCILLTLISLTGQAQDYDEIANLKTGDYPDQQLSVVGLWEVQLVTVGEESMTPVARWFEFRADGSQVSGNGWLQNGIGTWQYDAASSKLLTLDEAGQADEFGAFKIAFDQENHMTWERMEEGMRVKVTLTRIEQKPKGPWDKIVGGWECYQLESGASESELTIQSGAKRFSYFFRWDKRYRKFDAQGRRIETGIWHIEAHDPWMWLIPDDGSEKVGQYIAFEGRELVITRSGENVFKRLCFKKD